jgi:hypothetical protein
MAVVIPNDQDSPSFIGMAVRDRTDDFAARCASLDSGVVSGMAVTQNTGSDMNVAVATGTVAVAGTTYTYTGTGSPFAISAAGAGDRRDVVVYRAGTGVVVLTGTIPSGLTGAWTTASYPTLPPVKPNIVESTDVVLAEVYVDYNTTAIVTATNVVDKTNVLNQAVTYPTISTSSAINPAVVGTYYRCTGSLTLTLPTSPNTGAWVMAKLIASASTVTITGTVDGSASFTFSGQYQSYTFIYNGTSWDIN